MKWKINKLALTVSMPWTSAPTYAQRFAWISARAIKINDMAEPVEDCSDGCRADCQECVDNADKMELPNCSYWDDVFYCGNRTCEGKCSGGDCPPPNADYTDGHIVMEAEHTTGWWNDTGPDSHCFKATVVADDKKTKDDGIVRSFDTGATRDTGGNKLVFNKFLSAQAIEQYCRYMNMNRLTVNLEKVTTGRKVSRCLSTLTPDTDTITKHGRKRNTGETMSFLHGNMKWNTLVLYAVSSSILLAICMSG
jgi:hypothetical protein